MGMRGPAPALSEKMRVRFTSTPAGAIIDVVGGSTCTTPCDLEVANEALDVRAELVGHEPETRRLELPLPERVELFFGRRSSREKRPSQAPRTKEPERPPLLPR